MNRETFSKLMRIRELNHRTNQFEIAMAFGRQDIERIKEQLGPSYKNIGREETALIWAERRAAELREDETAAIGDGQKRLTLSGDLISLPTPDQIRNVEQLLNNLGL